MNVMRDWMNWYAEFIKENRWKVAAIENEFLLALVNNKPKFNSVTWHNPIHFFLNREKLEDCFN